MAMCGSKGRGRSLEASDVDHPWRYSWSRSALRDAFYLPRAADDTQLPEYKRMPSRLSFPSLLVVAPPRPPFRNPTLISTYLSVRDSARPNALEA
jgi:hypothetical protein